MLCVVISGADLASSTHLLPLRRYSLPALWHLLSLDAPTVAALWFTLAARAAHLHLHTADVASLALGVWMLYVLDRMLDARLGETHQHEERHHFHGANQNFFLGAMVCAAPVLLWLLTRMESPLLHAYLLLGLALAAYFTLIHTRPFAHRIPKEFAVGVIFAAAVFMPEWIAGFARITVAQTICFMGICWLNFVLIWEREHTQLNGAHWSTRFAMRHTPLLLAALVAAGVGMCFAGQAAMSASVALSALVMMGLHCSRERMARLPFRIAADAALLTPLVFLIR